MSSSSELDRVVISRRGGHTHPRHKRVFVGVLNTMMNGTRGRILWGASADPQRASKMLRKDAKALLARGRWHGLYPRIEEVPDA